MGGGGDGNGGLDGGGENFRLNVKKINVMIHQDIMIIL